MTEFYLIRHGQTTANALGMKQGTINNELTNLTDVGQQQVQALHEVFAIDFADAVIYSPLNRTKETAEILNQTAALPMSSDPRLLEISYGKWDGQKNSDLLAQYPQYFDLHLKDVLPTYVEVATDGETFAAVTQRVQEFIWEMSQKNPDGKFILVTHGFTIKAAALAALQPQDPMTLPEPTNASVTKLVALAKTKQLYLDYYNRNFGF